MQQIAHARAFQARSDVMGDWHVSTTWFVCTRPDDPNAVLECLHDAVPRHRVGPFIHARTHDSIRMADVEWPLA